MLDRMPKFVMLLVAAAVISVSGLLVTSKISWATQTDASSQIDAGGASGDAAFLHAAPSNKIYWADAGAVGPPPTGRIRRANLDGSGAIEDVITDRLRPSGVAVDPAGGKIYWSENAGPHRADLNGSGVLNITLLKAVASATIHIDLKNGKVYWASPLNDKIQRANLDGSNPEDDYALFFADAAGVEVDPVNSRLYWASAGENTILDPTDGKILRSINLGIPGPRLNRGGEPDGNYEIIVTSVASSTPTSLSDPAGLALDLSAGKVYWVDLTGGIAPNLNGGKIQRANLDGTNAEDLVTGLSLPYGIALDPINGHMYWTERGTKKIARADLDGGNQLDILTGLNDPWGLTLDVDRCPALTSVTPLDNDADWRCEDINANGRQDFQDVVALFQDLSAAGDPAKQFYFDFNSNNGVDFNDVVTLFQDLATLVGVLP